MKKHMAVWFTGLTSLALLTGLAVYLLPLQPNIVALQFTFNATDFQTVLQAWKPDGVALFRSHLPVDYLLLVDYGLFGYLLVRRSQLFTQCSGTSQRFFLWAMPLAALSDGCENGLHWVLTSGATGFASAWYLLAGVSSTLKFALMGVFLLSAVWQRGGGASSGG